ncbi:MAG: GNAT family N-acetyltransferase [Desulfatibacillum sp.]|nr:GNAT family N-acetyltransferase [Desulfatibacillum sp.]
MGSLVFGKDRTQLPSHAIRSKGAYDAIPEPLNTDIILSSFDRLLEAIFSKQVHARQDIRSVVIARIIDNYEDFLASCRLSYGVYDHLRYLNQHNRLRIDLDKFSPYSIPFGVFEKQESGEVLVGTTRLIFREKQEPFATFIDTFLKKENPPLDDHTGMTLADYVHHPLHAFSPMAESVDLGAMLKDWDAQGVKYAESSRNVVHPDYRGYGVSRLVMASALTHAFHSGLDLLIGQSDVNHVPMYQKYGVMPIPGMSLYMEETVRNITAALMIDFRKPLEGPADHMIKKVYRDKWAADGFLCLCPNKECTRRGAPFVARGGSECPLKNYSIIGRGRN